jgi:DNA-binding MarR family transcriptional regulator
MHRHLHSALEDRLQADAGVSAVEFEVLSTLNEVEGNQLRSRDLGTLMGWEKSRLSHQVRRMEARGLVERRECDSDLRGTFITLTDAGRAAVTAALPDHHAALRTLFFDQLNQDELASLRQLVDRVLSVLEPSACEVAHRVRESASDVA